MCSAIAAADGNRLVSRAFAREDVQQTLRRAAAIDVIAAGKAAFPMLRAFSAAPGFTARRGLVAGPEDSGDVPERVERICGRHPVPDERSAAAARRALEIAQGVGSEDVLLVLLSGGASSLMALPLQPVTLEDKQVTVTTLLRAGADIGTLNTVRKHLSAIKGGRLAVACGGTVVTLAISDVVSDDLSLIGSGPTVGDPSTFADALASLNRFGGPGAFPARVVDAIRRGGAGTIPETPAPDDLRLERSRACVIGSRVDALEGARAAAAALGYSVHILPQATTGEARSAALAYFEQATALMRAIRRPVCVLAAGETTVSVVGSGRGGRNQECALAMATAIATLEVPAVAASVGTDGIDGPTDAAGAVVDTATLARARDRGIPPPQHFLDDNNSYDFFSRLDDLIRTGPTGTNVGDLQILLAA